MIRYSVLPLAVLLACAAQKSDSPRPRTTYSGTKIIEPAAGGHATAGGLQPTQESAENDIRRLGELGARIDFQEVPVILEKTYFGGATKDHILESGGGGVALFDYDNDGWLDIYIVNGYQLTAEKKVIPHANLLYRNLGNWKFENVSAKAGVDGTAWGAGVCAGDYNNDGYLDLYVTNYGVNFLYRNNGNGTFTEVARQAGVNHRGWSTGCTFFD